MPASVTGLRDVRATVAVVRTSPDTVRSDYGRVLELGGCADVLRSAARVTVYGNLTWGRFFPGVSSPPWQLDGVARSVGQAAPAGAWHWLAGRGHTNRPRRAARANLWPQALSGTRHEVSAVDPRGPNLPVPHGPKYFVLDQLLGERAAVPEDVAGSVALHLPTYKAHGQLGLAGALENGWATWLPSGASGAALHPHELVVDLLVAQAHVHPAICAVMDGALVGDGAGPRTLDPRPGNVLLASTDPVALDATAARLAGFDPFSLRFIALAYAMGLGCADAEEIELVGDDVSAFDLRLRVRMAPAALTRTLLERLGMTRVEERVFARRRWLALASSAYYDLYWYQSIARPRLRAFRRTPWGMQFEAFRSR